MTKPDNSHEKLNMTPSMRGQARSELHSPPPTSFYAGTQKLRMRLVGRGHFKGAIKSK